MRAVLKKNGTIELEGRNGWDVYTLKEWTMGFVIHNVHTIVTEVVIENGVTIIPNQVFENCQFLKRVILPNSVTTIEKAAFAYSGLEKVLLSNALEIINDAAFIGCENLKEIHFPETVKRIGNSAFEGCDFENVLVPKGIEVGKRAFWKLKIS